MQVTLRLIRPRSRCQIYAMEDQSGCLVLEFMAQMEQEMPNELEKLGVLLDYTATNGPPKNKEKCNSLGNGLFEFKTKKLRVLWFWDAGYMIICTHGFKKKTDKTPTGEIRRALEAKSRYEEAKSARQLKIVEE